MSSTNGKKRLKVITVYTQTEEVYTNGVRRVVPIFLRPIDRKVFRKSKTVFTFETKYRVEVEKKAKLWPYIPVRSDNRTGSQLELVVDMDFSLKPVKEYFTPIRRKITAKDWYRREDCFKYVLTNGVGRDLNPRAGVSVLDIFQVWLKDHNYFKCDNKRDSDESVAQLTARHEINESGVHSDTDFEHKSGQNLK